MRPIFRVAVLLIILLPMLVAQASAALVGASSTTSGQLLYEGLGDVGGGVGSGRYTVGDCSAAATSTVCVLSGKYIESADSTHAAGQTGSFMLRLTYSGNGASPVVARSVSPGSDVLQFSSIGDALFTLTLFPASGGQITSVYPSAVFADSLLFSTFLQPGNFGCTGVPASGCSVGQVGLVPGASIRGGVAPFQFTIPQIVTASLNYQGLWYAAPAESESGWGINFAHQGDIIFASWFTYDANRKGLWLVMTAPKNGNVYSGTLFQLTGPPFDAVPFPAIGSPGGAAVTAVGNGTLSFPTDATSVFTYTVAGITQTKTLTRQVFGPLPTCTYSASPDFAAAGNYQDLWWAVPAGSEAGWGINLTHQGDIIFASWFTFDHDRTPLWLVATATKTAPGVYAGSLLRTTGPPFNSVPFPPAGAPGGATATVVGNATFNFTNGNNASFGYTVNGITQTKQITRQLFAPPAGTVCR